MKTAEERAQVIAAVFPTHRTAAVVQAVVLAVADRAEGPTPPEDR